jgi:hypothetical protein
MPGPPCIVLTERAKGTVTRRNLQKGGFASDYKSISGGFALFLGEPSANADDVLYILYDDNSTKRKYRTIRERPIIKSQRRRRRRVDDDL